MEWEDRQAMGGVYMLRAHLGQVHEVGHQARVGCRLLALPANLAQVVQCMQGLHLDGQRPGHLQVLPQRLYGASF